jgi:hypothetical protein
LGRHHMAKGRKRDRTGKARNMNAPSARGKPSPESSVFPRRNKICLQNPPRRKLDFPAPPLGPLAKPDLRKAYG